MKNSPKTPDRGKTPPDPAKPIKKSWIESRSWRRLILPILFVFANSLQISYGCQFLPLGEYLRFVRVPENLRVGDKITSLEVLQRHNLTLESIDKGDDAKYFALSESSGNKVDLLLARSLENIVDNDGPQNILKFRIVCYPSTGSDKTPSFLLYSLYVEDINDHAPTFIHAPYYVTVDELTPIGLTVFRGISAVDMDKPNTGNSDIRFSIVDGNDEGKFGLESSQNPALIVKKNLDYDTGDKEFKLKIMASDRGNPPLASYSFITIKVIDNDDLPIKFTKSLYKTQIKEFYPFKNKTIRQEVVFPSSSKILAYDQDIALNVSVEYDIVGGNEGGYFDIDRDKGTLFLVREVDREALASPSNTFNLQLRASQSDDVTKTGEAKVEIEILDLNDCLPQFEVDVYNISIMENLPNGFSVLHVQASDADQGENAEFLYKLEDRTRAFQIDPKSGWLTVRDQSQLDREKMSQINLKVLADEKVANIAFGTTKSYATVEVHLLDSNDANPTFLPSNLYKFQVTIDSEIGSVVGQVNAEDPDLGGNGKIVYEIQKPNGTSTNEELPFEIDSTNGYIYLLERPLPKLHYTLLVEASDQPVNPSERRYSLAVVQIDVVKAGTGHSPEFIGSPYEFWVGSHVGIGTSVGHIKVNHLDAKYTVFDLLHSYYEGVPFAIEERTGIIAVVDDISKYSRTIYEFEAYVTDSRHTLTTNVTIHIVDPLESASASEERSGSSTHRNKGRREPIELTVKENVGGAIVGNLKTLLSDSLRDVRGMEFVLANYDARDKFAIGSDGTIYTLKPLDREEKPRHLLTVISQSRGVIQGQGVYEIWVNVEDANDSSPKFDRQQYEGYIRENSMPGTPITMEHPINVIDPDEGINAQFTLELKGDGADRFLVHPKNKKIVVGNIPLDREEKHIYNLKLIATDTGKRNSTATISIHIQDTNDNPPVFFQNIVLDPPDLENGRELLRAASAPVSVEISNSEPIRIPETVPVGSRIARVLASDKDSGDNSKIFYRIVSENSNPIGGKFSYLTDKQYLYSRNKDKHFVVDRSTGEISVAKPLKPDTEYALNISASDRGGLRAYTGIKIVVQDVNDHVPKFDRPWYSFELLEGSYHRHELGKINAKDGDTGLNGEITYSLQPKTDLDTDLDYSDAKIPFNIDPVSGTIYVDGIIDRENRAKYSFFVQAKDKGPSPMDSIVDVDVNIMDVNDNPPKFYGYIAAVKVGQKSIPVYRTSIKSNLIPPNTQVFKVSANDSDSPSNGNGLVLFHLANNHKSFYIDSKNGTISTLTQLEYERSSLQAPEYNLTVIASDLGQPSLSSTAWVLIRLSGSGGRKGSTSSSTTESSQELERMFAKEVYTYYVPHRYNTPHFLTKMNVTEKYKRYPTEYHLFGGDKIIENFRIGPKTGEIFVIKMLKPGTTYDMLVRAFSSQLPSRFDVRQGSQISDRYLEHNEALIRVEMLKAPSSTTSPVVVTVIPRNNESDSNTASGSGHKPRVVYKTTSTTTTKASSIVPVAINPPKTPKIITASNPNLFPPRNDSENEIIGSTKSNKSHHKNSYFYAGEIAVLVMSCVVFLGGLVAAVSIACVRRKRQQRHRRRLSHIPAIPVEVRLQKQPLGGSRPILFPMALPGVGEPHRPQNQHGNNGGTESSDATSETYTDGGGPEIMHHQRSASFVNVHKTGLVSVCPDCRKIRKPNSHNVNNHSSNNQNNRHKSRVFVNGGVARGVRGKSRHPREVSLPSSNDSGIDDGQLCHCCQNSSSSERDHYEDSLMTANLNARASSKSFRRKRNPQTPYPPQALRGNNNGSRFSSRLADGIVIL